MRGRSIFFLPALLFPALLLGAQQVPSDLSTVDDLVRAGIANNKDLAAVREQIAEAAGLKRQAGVRPAPSLSLNGATGKPLGTIGQEEYGAEFSQSIETFGKRGKRIRVADFSIGIAEADLQQRSLQLAFEIRTAYAEVLAERHKLRILGDLIGLNQDIAAVDRSPRKRGRCWLNSRPVCLRLKSAEPTSRGGARKVASLQRNSNCAALSDLTGIPRFQTQTFPHQRRSISTP